MPLRLNLASVPRTARMLRSTRPYYRPLFSNHLSTPRGLSIGPHTKLHPANSITHRSFSVSRQICSANTVVRVPTMAESITEGTLVQLTKKVGDFIEQDEELATIETDKIDVSVNAPHSGIIQQLLVSEGDTVTVDQNIAEIQPAENTLSETSDDTSTREVNSGTSNVEQRIEDVNQAKTSQASSSSSAESQNTTTPFPPEKTQTTQERSTEDAPRAYKRNRGENRVKMTRIRQKTAQHLKQSQNTAAFLTTFNEVDMSKLMEFRKKNREEVLEKHGIKLGYMGAMARASSLALKEIPAVNAAIEDEDTIVYRDYVDLSVAAAIPKGLVTPVLRNVESMGLVEIEKNIANLVAKARDGKLTMDDLMGGSFTISNSGVWGSLFGTPIINMPQTAVLGVYGIQDRPVAVNGQVEIRPMMYIALTYDHRIIDGREAVKFLNLVKGYLEEPNSMLLN